MDGGVWGTCRGRLETMRGDGWGSVGDLQGALRDQVGRWMGEWGGPAGGTERPHGEMDGGGGVGTCRGRLETVRGDGWGSVRGLQGALGPGRRWMNGAMGESKE